MAQVNFSMTLVSDQTPEQVFQAITNVRAWWSGYYAEEFSGDTTKLHDEFTFRTGDGVHYSKHKLVEVIPNQKIVWLITDSTLTFIEHQQEWVGSKVIFEISREGNKTHLIFTHEGLTPEVECYDACAPAWTQYLQNKLLPMINTQITTKPK
jgi:uncharacterized protein YndB with AHSA1/START domain